MLPVYAYLGLILILTYTWFWWSRRSLWIHAESFPGPRWLPLIGNLNTFSTNNTTNFKKTNELFDKFGSVYRCWMGPVSPYIFVKDPQVIKQILTHPKVTDHSKLETKVLRLFGEGLLGINGEKWKRHRKLMNPAFNRQILQTYVLVFAEKARTLTGVLGELCDGRSFNINKNVSLCTLDGVLTTVIGAEENSQTHGDCSVLECLEVLSEAAVTVFFNPLLLIGWIRPLTKVGKSANKAINEMQELSEGVIRQKLEAHRRGEKRTGITTASDKKINSFLDMMIEAEGNQDEALTANELRDEVSTLLLTGTDTSALTMSYLLVLIAIHFQVQQQIQEELDAIFGDSRREVTLEDLNQMSVLDRVIKETLRLYPVVPASPRYIPEDMHLSNGKTLPKGSSVLICPYAMHRDEANYKDANGFWPDRWLPENTPDNLHPFAYLPFSGGNRVCIGRHYAMLQMKCTLSELLRVYHVATKMSERDLIRNLTTGVSMQLSKDSDGFVVQLKNRDQTKNVY